MTAVAVAALQAPKRLLASVPGGAARGALPATGHPSPLVTALHAVAEAGSNLATGSATAATGQPAPWWVIPALLVAALAWLGGYAVACWIWPYTACPKCDGTARIQSPSGKRFRLCRKCKASGRRVRTGRRVYNFVRAKRKAADW